MPSFSLPLFPQIFARMVGLLHLDERSPWAFLKPVQRSKCPVPREALVRKASSDRAVLQLVLATVEDVRLCLKMQYRIGMSR